MNKNSLLLSLILLFGSLSSIYAQKFEGEIILGPSLTSTRGNDSLQNILKATINFSCGVGMNYHLTPNQLVGIRLLFDKKGASTGYDQFTYSAGPNPGDIKEGRMKLSTRYNYLTLPIQYKYRWGNTIQYEIGAGMYASYLLSQNIVGKAKGSAPAGFEGSSNITNNDKRYDLGVSAGFSVLIPLQKSTMLNVGLNENFGLTNVHKTTIYNSTSTRHNSLMLLLGINYKFKKG